VSFLFALVRVVLAGSFAFLAGLPLTDRARHLRFLSGATWLRGGGKVAVTRIEHLHWYAWAGWQRSVVRLVGTVLAVCLLAWPMWTAVALGGTFGIASLAAYATHRRRRLALGPVRVKAVTR
jgi:hypothetical protein